MGKRICLTEEQKEAERVRRLNQRIADGLAAYKNRNRMTSDEVADSLGIGKASLYKLLYGEGIKAGPETWYKILRAAGLRIIEVKEELPL